LHKNHPKSIFMKRTSSLLLFLLLAAGYIQAQQAQPGKVDRLVQKGQQAVNKVKTIIAVFQPYLIKAKELYGQGKELAGSVKGAAKGLNGATATGSSTGTSTTYTDNSNTYPPATTTPPTTGDYGNAGGTTDPYATGTTPAPEYYLPVNEPATVNNDGSGNWGNQNNALYGNCLDVMTGTVMGMGEAADNPASVDLMFFASTDVPGNYLVITPNYVRTNAASTYMTGHASDPVLQWKDISESEIALTKMTIGQFNQIQNNNQISNAVRNAQNYAGYLSFVGQRVEGQVLAIRTQMENREVYALVAVEKQVGVSGSNGYLRIRIKAQGVDNNNNGIPDANYYIR
jgi:hypothetical protein